MRRSSRLLQVLAHKRFYGLSCASELKKIKKLIKFIVAVARANMVVMSECAYPVCSSSVFVGVVGL